MTKKVNYFEAERIAPDRDDTSFSNIISPFVPTFLSALETRVSRSFWATDEDFARAYNEIKRQQWELLMDATDRIVSEIRALRMGGFTPENWRDPAISPYNFDATSLVNIQFNLQDNEGSAAQILARIEDILQRTEEGDGSQLEALLQIVALLAPL